MSKAYKDQKYQEYRFKIAELEEIMPRFCHDYYIGRRLKLTDKTQFDYISKMKIFLDWLRSANPYFAKKELTDITVDDMTLITKQDIDEFCSWLLNQKKYRNSSRHTETNTKSTVNTYLSCISSYYSFFIRSDWVKSNPVELIERDNHKDQKPLSYLDPNQKYDYVDSVSTGNGLTDNEMKDYKKAGLRDYCIIAILITTGIRVSELVGLDLTDVDLDNHCLSVQRKGDKPDLVFFPNETGAIISDYLETERYGYSSVDELQPLFLSRKGTNAGERLGVRSVEKLVKKYAKASKVTNAQTLHAHSLRATFAMASLAAKNNVELVRAQLGHGSLAATSHYVKASDKMKLENRNNVTLH